MSATPWFRDREALRLIGFRYLPWLGGLNLAWEMAQLPLYTLWREAPAAWIAYAVLHCTAGDVVIGGAVLLAGLIATRASAPAQWRWGLIAPLAALAATGYTAFSESLNTAVLRSWSYSALMPTVEIAGIEIGVSPLLQWLVIPPLALRFARATGRGTQAG
ncbi:MAG: hypothetical protein A3I63_11680 [Betaproteobacteria bacterium RIFCSPLOWO2_02_FULL_66_14]|nr:MAG: hypothetical protein A3I63_11680 [Betaproteobacteria bacterium RIFCSPLOWO2_02_FULL_66_14]